jgi:hypothetical protein
MPEEAVPKVRERVDTANLRLELNALESKINAASLPEALRSVRRTVAWGAILIAVALIVSSVIHTWGSSKVDRLERRVELLERYHAGIPPR